ncbi:MAG TPA: branched-chain amino acid ABC transporter substrate-binding protein, partial [Candidatus Competibacteraceae bacterium]|nr:branched-chain amino acid ABC transporter substrate-binding protein [Candidatus Competibacteraceae bacterium]
RLNQRGVKEVLYEGLTRGEKDFNALVTKIKATGAEAVYFGGCYPEAGALVRQMREQGVGAKLVGGDCVLNPDLVAAAGGAQYTDGVYVTFGRDARNIPESKQVVESFRKSGFEPDGYTLYAYAAVQSIAAAMQASGSTEGKAVADWLKANTVPTAMGPKGWDSKGDLKVSDFVMYVYGADGVARELNN